MDVKDAKMEINDFYSLLIGKKVYIVTSHGRNYCGKVLAYSPLGISLKDKFGMLVLIKCEDIASLEEQRF